MVEHDLPVGRHQQHQYAKADTLVLVKQAGHGSEGFTACIHPGVDHAVAQFPVHIVQ